MKAHSKNTTNTDTNFNKTDLAISAVFGKIKTNIDFSFDDKSKLCIMVTSTLPNEGKTTISANTAAAMAASGKKTLLIDADLRNASLHILFNAPNVRGLNEIITQNADWRDFLFKTTIPNLTLLTTGRKPMNSTKFVSSMRFKTFLKEVCEEYDYVIIDTPPVLLIPDSQVISPLVDGVVIVINSGKTPAKAVKNAYTTLKRANANIIGSVMNNVSKRNSAYGYGYGYGYGVEPKKNARKQAQADARSLRSKPE